MSAFGRPLSGRLPAVAMRRKNDWQVVRIESILQNSGVIS